MNDLFRQCNKRAYEIEGTINDLYCDKVANTQQVQASLDRQMDVLNEDLGQLTHVFQKQSPSDANYVLWQE